MWSLVNDVLNAVFNAWLFPFRGLAPVWQLLVLALPATLISLLIFRFASNQAGITDAKNKIKAYLLELRIFQDDIGVTLRSQGHILRHTLRYMGHALVPMLIMIVPFVLILAQVESRMAFRSLEPGEQAVLSVVMDGQERVSGLDPEIRLPDGLTRETRPVRIDSTGEILWRIRANKPGSYRAAINIGQREIEKTVIVDGREMRLAPAVYRADDIRSLLYPAEPGLESGQPVKAVMIEYPRSRGEFAGLSSASWLLFLFTLVLGYALRGVMGVTF